MKHWYVLHYNYGRATEFLGYTDSEYLCQSYVQMDECNNAIVEEFDCTTEEFCQLMKSDYDPSFDLTDDKLKLYACKNIQKCIVTTPKWIYSIVYQADCMDKEVSIITESLYQLLEMSKYLRENKELQTFILYIILTKIMPALNSCPSEDDFEDVPLDPIYLLVKEGYIGTIK